MLSIFATSTDEVIFYGVYTAWLVLEITLIWFIPILRKNKVKKVERKSTALLVLSIFISLFLAFYFSYLSLYTGIGWLPSWLFIPGIALMLAGIAFRDWAVATLGHLFSPNVSIMEGHRLVSTGPYKWVRHPAYGGTLIIMSGISISLRSALSLVATLAITYPILWARAKREEQLLEQELGEEYRTYSRRVKKRFIPFLI